MTPRSRMRHVRSLLPATGLLLTVALAPYAASADTDLAIGGTGVVAYADGDNVRVRTSPGYEGSVVTEVPEGSTVDVLDGTFTANDGSLWYEVAANGETGYMVSDYLANSGGMLSATSGEAMTIDSVNVRTGPSLADSILATMDAGEWLALTGENANGWLSVDYDGYHGYIYGAFLTQDGEVAMDGSSATEASEPASSGATGTRFTNDSVNLRSGPGLGESVITVFPAGVEVWLTGAEGNGFVEISSGSGDGWISVDYLSTEAPVAAEAEAPVAASSSIIWPVSGGEWSFLQGYNGSSHQNSGSLWQYGDSIDLVRTDGNTAGQPVYSPVNGTIRWFDPSTGGISIDMGNGYAFAMFHAYYDGGLSEGQRVSQGQYLGTIAPAYEAAAGSHPHLHIALWATSDGGNWDRNSVPFTGELALSGQEFYNSGTAYEHTGTVIYP